MNNMYIIPANTKSGKLIFNIFRGIDLVVFLTGLGISLIFLVVIPSDSLLTTILKVLPLGISTFLVVPIPNYHNVMNLIKEIYLFLSSRRIYYWKGWCVRNEFKDE